LSSLLSSSSKSDLEAAAGYVPLTGRVRETVQTTLVALSLSWTQRVSKLLRCGTPTIAALGQADQTALQRIDSDTTRRAAAFAARLPGQVFDEEDGDYQEYVR